MGYVNATIALSNPRRPELAPLSVSARADSGSLMLCIRAHLAAALRLEQESLPEVSVADGRRLQVPHVGPLRVDFHARCCLVGALVLGDEVLIGAVPMEDMDLVVNPALQRLDAGPRSPHLPHARV
jgi:clan AA aspartic protease